MGSILARRRLSARHLVGACGAALLLGCQGESVTSTTAIPIDASQPALACGTGNANSGVGALIRFYACGESIRFVLYTDNTIESGTFDSSGTTAMLNALEAAGNWWNSAALSPSSANLPEFVTSGGTRTIVVKYSGGNVNNPWTGTVLAAGGGELGPGAPPAEIRLGHGAAGTLDEVARHELAHVLGILGDGSAYDWHNKHPPAVVGHCAFAITSSILAQSACPQLKEILFGLYGAITRPINDNLHIVTVISGNEGHTLQVGQTASAVPTSLGLDVANYSVTNPGAQGALLAQPANDGAAITSGFLMSYVSLNLPVASVSTNGVITAASSGVAKIVRTVTSLPSGYQTSSFITGDTVLVTVLPQTTVTVAHGAGGQGGGVVTSTTPPALGINCTIAVSSSSGTCSGNVNTGTAVTLSAAANLGYKLSTWGGGCSGSATTCSPSTAGSSVNVTAAFIVKPISSVGRLECEPNGSQRRQQLTWTTTGYPAGTTVTVITNTTNNTGTATTIGSAVALSQGAGWWTPFLSNTANRYFWVKANVSGSSSTWAAWPVIQSSGPCPLF